jgi:hypothetical protein
MSYPSRWLRLAATAVAGTLLVGACSPSDTSPTTTPATGASTSATAATTSTTGPASSTTTTTGPPAAGPTVTASEGIDDAVVARLTEEVTDLISATEDVRGLTFLEPPTIAIVTADELEARVRTDLEQQLDPAEAAIETRFYQLLGLLGPGDDLETMLIDLYGEQVAGFYDGDTEEMVIGGDAADLTPLTKSVIVHELVHALTDQHFLFNADYEALFDDQEYDQGSAFQALIEGDATYFQFVYIEQMSPADRLALATEAMQQLADSTVFASVPNWVQADLSFPYDSGQVFVQALVDAGGIAAVDRAYQDRPVSTEVVMHPSRYLGGEGVLAVDPVSISLPGYDVFETSTLGEWGIRVILSGGNLQPGVVTQAANGWGGDSYQILTNGDELVFALAYKGDSEDDAFELADALITELTATMGEGTSTGGGVSFTTEEGHYAYLDRIGDGFEFVIATDAAAGEAAQSQVAIP